MNLLSQIRQSFGNLMRFGGAQTDLTAATLPQILEPLDPLPRAGDVTEGNMVLSVRPSLLNPPEVKFAAFTDKRIQDPEMYLAFSEFIPEELRLVGAPAPQNSFAHVLGLEGEIDRFQFADELRACGYEQVDGVSRLQGVPEPGDIIAYYRHDPDNGFAHAGRALGGGRVESRWGPGCPVVEHPADEVIPIYMDPQIGDFIVYRRAVD